MNTQEIQLVVAPYAAPCPPNWSASGSATTTTQVSDLPTFSICTDSQRTKKVQSAFDTIGSAIAGEIIVAVAIWLLIAWIKKKPAGG